MKIIVFGATGTVGRHVVDQALAAGHQVTAFARRPGALAPRAGLAAMAGDVLDTQAVRRAVAGHDAVICALGAGRRGGLRAPGTANIIEAMKAEGVRRLICQTTLGAGDSEPALNFFWRRIMFGLLLRPAMLDHEAQERLVRGSGLDWTIVRPAAFTDDPAGGAVRHGLGPVAPGLKLKIGRADVARFLLGQLSDPRYLRAAPGLSL